MGIYYGITDINKKCINLTVHKSYKKGKILNMLQIFLILIVIGIIMSIIEFIKDNIIPIIVVILSVGTLIVLWHFLGFKLILLLIIVMGISYFIYNQNEKEKMRRREEEARRKAEARRKRIESNHKWLEENQTSFLQEEVNDIFTPLISQVYRCGGNTEDYLFTYENMPYGRANAFLNFFEKNIYSDEPLYFSCEPSQTINEFKEYGLMITSHGIYSILQCESSYDKSYITLEGYLPFSGLKRVKKVQSNYSDMDLIQWNGINLDGDDCNGQLYIRHMFSDILIDFCNTVINKKLNIALYTNTIYADEATKINEQKLVKQKTDSSAQDIVGTSAIGATTANFNNSFSETKNYMNANRGSGYAAEYANNTVDRILGKDVESTAQVLDEHGRQVKGGADRTVNGVEIQTKYCKTASESISAAFNKQLYIRSDGSGKMMPIEVPRDQYEAAIELMQKRIDNGQVPGIEPGESARTYVRKGYFTYAQAWNIAKAGTLESLTVDAASGAVCTSEAAGLSALIIFAQQIWSGNSVENAISASLSVGARVIGTGTLIYTLTMQLSRNQIANPFAKEFLANGEYKGFAGINNPIFGLSENIATKVRNSVLAQSGLGNALKLTETTGKTLISGTLIGLVTFGPDIYRALEGRISKNQLMKNTTVGTAALVGSQIGNAVIPGIGGIIGGAATGFVAKKFMDEFVEDDAIKMFRILKEEFIDSVSLANLTKAELEEVIKCTIGNNELSKILRNMYAHDEHRFYAKTSIMQPAILSVISKRKKILRGQYTTGIEELLLAPAV